jgi:GntR family transcriptional regulator/MocR family aminotransferase
VRAEATAPPLYPDPRGELELRREIAGYLAVARGIECTSSQVIITGGYSAGLGLTLAALEMREGTAWVEDPGFLFARKGLELGGLSLAPVPVDGTGIDVEFGIRHFADAKLVVVTPGQQAPLGPTLSLARRLRLLDWAIEKQAWILEDDYLSELQLSGRAAPALASLDRNGRVIHIGSFSKTISPTLRLGFLVVPTELVSRFSEVAACLAPAPGPAVQLATSQIMREGHYLRHLRRTKRAYVAKRQALTDALEAVVGADRVVSTGLAILLKLPEGASDLAIAREAPAFGLSPSPLSTWYVTPERTQPGLLLSVATAPARNMDRSCGKLFEMVERFG